MVSPLHSRDRARSAPASEELHVDRSNPELRAAKPVTVPKWEPTAAQDAYFLEAVRQVSQQMKLTGCGVEASKAPSPRGPSNDDVLYIGTNDESVNAEAKVLRGMLGEKHVIAVDATKGTTVTNDGVAYNLDTADGRRAFVASLGLPADKAAKLETLLSPEPKTHKSSAQLRALAHIAMAWAPAERGGNAPIPSRLLVSGHSGAGTTVGGVNVSSIQALAAIMPNAARQVEDVCLSACSSAVNAAVNREEWTKAFPNLKTIWSYNGAAPSPGTVHFGTWASATAGRQKDITLSTDLKSQNVAVWSASSGYHDRGEPVDKLLARAAVADAHYQGLVDGSIEVKDSHAQPCEGDYRLYRKLSQHQGLTSAQRNEYGRKADALLRIRYYPDVGKAFAKNYAADIERAYASVGMTVPDFARLSRKEAHAQILALKEKLAKDASPPKAVRDFAQNTLTKFDSLDRYTVPEEWFVR
jgi:hypothetical protein